MSNKELILKRLLEEKHITIEEMFILNEKENNAVVIKDLNPYPVWQQPHHFYYNTCTSNKNPMESKNIIPSDYKMD